jgi:hypothetical protein
MDIDAGFRMCDLGDDARDERRAETMEPMGDPMMDDRGQRRIGKQHLVDAAGGGIIGIPRLDIAIQRAADAGQACCEGAQDMLGAAPFLGAGDLRPGDAQLEADLGAELRKRRFERRADPGILIARIQLGRAEPEREQGGAEFAQDARQRAARWKLDAALGMPCMGSAPVEPGLLQAIDDHAQVAGEIDCGNFVGQGRLPAPGAHVLQDC